ncbi:MAG: VWA domain-containing protein [Pyrinomonadaceae bacterium]|nr:VWA domain-containing protein [Pyrinomonadaceae bacterium]
MQFFIRILVGVAFFSAFPAFSVVSQTPSNSVYQGVQIDAPAGGQIRIENQYGEVRIEVWKEKYVSVSAFFDPGASFVRSPVVIENRLRLLAISVVRRRNDPVAAIELAVKVPENAHVEIVTGKHTSVMNGLPSSALMTSLTGDIKVELPPSVNADISAKSTKGSINSTIPQLVSSSGHVLQSRVGAGGQALRITTQSGTITLTAAAPAVARERGNEESDDPLTLTPRNKAAGIPAPLSDTQEVSEGDVIRVDSQLVTLNMSVVDRNTSRGLLGLGRSDFRLFENGAEQQILQFESSAAPFDLLLLIDLSGSTKDKVALIRAAALRFINAARSFDRIGVITFAGKPTVISSLTLDRQTLRDRVNAMETAVVGDTKLYDATDFAATLLLQETQNKRRTAIVLMSDGLDGSIEGVRGDGSRLPYQDLLSRVQEFDGVLYTLWLNTSYVALHPDDTQPEAFDDAHDQMQELASVGGGLFYEVKSLQDLAGAYERVVADLGTVYSLAYRPSDKARDGKWRSIKVNVNRPAAVARGKRGYYAN